MQEVYVIMTELNGYKNIYGHLAFTCKEEAEKYRRSAEESGYYDYAYIFTLGLQTDKGVIVEPIDALKALRDNLQEELGRMDAFEFYRQNMELAAKLGKPVSEAIWEEVMEASNDKA